MKLGPFDSLFDFDSDGKLGAFERSVQMQFLDDISRGSQSDSYERRNSWDSDLFDDSDSDFDDLDDGGRDDFDSFND